jgi:hypothetical protein
VNDFAAPVFQLRMGTSPIPPQKTEPKQKDNEFNPRTYIQYIPHKYKTREKQRKNQTHMRSVRETELDATHGVELTGSK